MHNKGLAAIPLILGLAFMVISTAVAVDLSQKNQNLQNKAAYQPACTLEGSKGCYTNPCCTGLICSGDVCLTRNTPTPRLVGKASCSDFIGYYNQYCGPNPGSNPAPANTIPCAEAYNIISNHCTKSTSTPTRAPTMTPTRAPTVTPTKITTIVPFKTPVPQACKEGQSRPLGRFSLVCKGGRWTITR